MAWKLLRYLPVFPAMVWIIPAQAEPRYNVDIRPILAEKCFACHGPDAKQRKAGLRLDEFESATRALENGHRAIVPGARAESTLWQRITASHADDLMPPPESKKTLSREDIDLLGAWIDAGAGYEPHWAFVPPRHAEVPAMDRGENAIDAFILRGLREKGLAPNAEADRRTLIRRASQDLLGLPPTPEAVEAFVNDPAPDAWDRLLDELLASPHFGERWARHWLDVARFAESHGYEQDYDRPYAYHYRDFVVRAFNEDLPYDQFVRWQLAGDELEPKNPQALAATGFLGAGTHATQITKSQVEKERYDELDDMARTTSLAFLGLTLGCARCHDHKYDPIPMEDYYRLVSTFTTTVRADLDINLDPEGHAAALAAHEATGAPLTTALKAHETALREPFGAWLAAGAPGPAPDWVVLEFEALKSELDAVFTRLEDGSYRVGGRFGNHDSFTLTARQPLAGITGVRLEALRDPVFVKGGPGRADNGNFALSHFALSKQGSEAGDQPVPLALINPQADYVEPGLDIAGVLDDQGGTGWAVDGGQGADHAAVFEASVPFSLEAGETLGVDLQFKMRNVHTMGRFRVSVTTHPAPLPLTGTTVPQALVPALERVRSGEPATAEAEMAALFDYYCQLDPEWRELRAAVERHAAQAPLPERARMMVCSEGVPAIRTHTQGGDFLEQTHYLQRGDPNQKGAVAAQGFVHALMKGPESTWQVSAPEGSPLSYRRTALANWITDFDRGAGFLLARVMVNRLWQLHLGKGIVATPSDFGLQGAAPTNPELLDWLALTLVENGWRLKPVHKLIMTSATYRQSSAWDEAKNAVDPENALWWRFPPRRLEAEAIRDNLLAVSGLLDTSLHGPGTLDPAHLRRSLYFMVKRSRLVPMMMLFDAPDTTQSLAGRATTTIAPQALHLMNNGEVRTWAAAFAARVAANAVAEEEMMLRTAYRLALSRDPDARELAAAQEFLRVQQQSYVEAGEKEPRRLAFTDFCQVLMGLNEFVYIE